MSLAREVGLGPGDIELDGDWGPTFPSPKKGAQQPPTFQPVCCGQTARWIRMPLVMEVGLGAGHIVLDGDPAPPPKGAHPHKFLAHVCCGQTAGWIKMPLGTNLGLGPDHIVLDGDPAPPKRDTAAPFSAYVYCGGGETAV